MIFLHIMPVDGLFARMPARLPRITQLSEWQAGYPFSETGKRLLLVSVPVVPKASRQAARLINGNMFAVSFSYEEGKFVPVVFGLATDRRAVYQYSGTPMQWELIGGPADRIWGGGPYLCATEPGSGNLWQYTGTPEQWTQIGGPRFMFSQSRHGLFGLSPDKQAIFYYTGTPMEWVPVGGPAGQIVGSLFGLFATNPDSGDLYEYGGTPGNWTRIGGPASMFAACTAQLFSLAPDKSTVYKNSGTPMQWRSLDRPAYQIFGGGDYLLITSQDTRNVWQWYDPPL